MICVVKVFSSDKSALKKGAMTMSLYDIVDVTDVIESLKKANCEIREKDSPLNVEITTL